MLRYYACDSEVQLGDIHHSTHRRGLGRVPAAQQPAWDHHPDLGRVRAELAELPALVHNDDIRALRRRLSRVEEGTALLLHVGECAELFAMANPEHVGRRVALYRGMADRLAERTGREVVLVTRMAGQHAKPRSEPFETLPDGSRVLSYRGDAVNRLAPAPVDRRADPRRMLASYWRSRDTVGWLGERADEPVFVSHEALLRDYEEAMTRGEDTLVAGSGHLVWIGERTRNVWNWHVQWAALLANPVGVKIGPTATSHNVVDIVHALNPWHESGRLSLITRMGAAKVADRLPAVIKAVSYMDAPVLWQCDPMHGNTRKHEGTKVRFLRDVRDEISLFVQTLRAARCHPGGLHLEVTPEDVRECHEDAATASGHESSPPCDPRLNPEQAVDIVDHFADEIRRTQPSALPALPKEIRR